MRVEVIGDATLYCGDCREVLPTLSGVDTVMTSPPYLHQRDYGVAQSSDWLDTVGVLAFLPDNTQILVNLGLIFRDGEVIEYWDGLKQKMRAAGWKLFGWYVWDKGFGMPAGDLNRPSTTHEWVFHFNHMPRPINKWVPTISRQGRSDAHTIRQSSGFQKGCVERKLVQSIKIPDSVIRTPPHMARGGIENEHPAIFPVDFPAHFIRTFSNPGETVLDPFAGSGTTGVACAKLGRAFIGIEIDPGYFDIACRRIEQSQRQSDLFVKPAKPPANETLPL